jgi:hypothetical protein
MKLINIVLLGFSMASAQAATVAIKDMTLVQESGSIASIASNFGHHGGGHHGGGFHGGFHGDGHHGGGHHGVKPSKAKSKLPTPQING